MNKDFIPVQVVSNGEKQVWHIDASRLGLERLLLLQKELSGTLIHSDVVIEGIMYSMIGVSKMSYGISGNTRIKEEKRKNKAKKRKIMFKEEMKK